MILFCDRTVVTYPPFLATGEGENDAETNQTATDNFFRRHDVDDFDTLKELVKATKKRGESRLQKARNKHLPPLNDFPQAAVTPHWPNISSKRIFSAGLKDNTIKRGFHVKESEVLFWLTGGKSSLREKGDKESCLDIGKAYVIKHHSNLQNLRYYPVICHFIPNFCSAKKLKIFFLWNQVR